MNLAEWYNSFLDSIPTGSSSGSTRPISPARLYHVRKMHTFKKAVHMQASEKGDINKVTAQSNQLDAEHSGQPVEHCALSKKSGDQAEEQWTMEHCMHQVLNNERQIVDKNIENLQDKEVVLLHRPEMKQKLHCPGERCWFCLCY